ncbi:MAG: glycosyltransferase family 9 protein [Planctomycetota bacterium]
MEDRFAPLLSDHPQIDSLHVYERKRLGDRGGWRGLLATIRALRAEKYDTVLDLQGNMKSGVLTRLTGAPQRIGLAPPQSREGNRLFMTECIDAVPGHRIETYRSVLDRAFGPGEEATAVLPATPESHGALLFHPGVSGFGAFKRWPAEHFAQLGDRLADSLDLTVMITAGPGERPQAEAVRDRMRTPSTIVEPPSLKALVNTLAGAHLVVAADTGPAHLAAAVGVPTVTLFGPKDPAILAPIGPRAVAVRAGVRCSPCALRACPDPICMSQLSVDLVEREARALLEAGAR